MTVTSSDVTFLINREWTSFFSSCQTLLSVRGKIGKQRLLQTITTTQITTTAASHRRWIVCDEADWFPYKGNIVLLLPPHSQHTKGMFNRRTAVNVNSFIFFVQGKRGEEKEVQGAGAATEAIAAHAGKATPLRGSAGHSRRVRRQENMEV